MVTRYVEGLPSDYRSTVRRSTNLNAAMIEACLIDDDLKLKEEEMKAACEKRKFEGPSGSSKKFKSGSNSKNNNDYKKGGVKCIPCNSTHTGPCTIDTLRCSWCGENKHLRKY